MQISALSVNSISRVVKYLLQMKIWINVADLSDQNFSFDMPQECSIYIWFITVRVIKYNFYFLKKNNVGERLADRERRKRNLPFKKGL